MHTNRINELVTGDTPDPSGPLSRAPRERVGERAPSSSSASQPDPSPATCVGADAGGQAFQSNNLPALLTDYLTANLPLEGLAARHNLTLPQLLDTLESPAFLTLLERTERISARRAAAIARAAAPDAALTLTDIAQRTTDKNPEPARKAANTLLKLKTEPEAQARSLLLPKTEPEAPARSPLLNPQPEAQASNLPPLEPLEPRQGLVHSGPAAKGDRMRSNTRRGIAVGTGIAMALASTVTASTVTASTLQPEITDPAIAVSPAEVVPAPVFEPPFKTGYEPGEATGRPPEAITWMTFENTSTQQDASPWAMSVFYESPGDANDRRAQLVEDPAAPGNTVLHYWLKNAVIESGYQSHTKGRIQTGFPAHLVDAVEIYGSQRMFLHEDMNLLHSYPPDGDRWWLGIILQELWCGAAWEGHPNPTRINLSMYSQGGQMRLYLRCETMPDMGELWQRTNPGYALPVGEWVTVEIGFKMGDAETGRMVVMVTPESTGEREVVFDVTDRTYDPIADQPDGTGPVPLTHWNPQKLYASDNVIHHIRDSGGVAQIYWDDFAFAGKWPPMWK